MRRIFSLLLCLLLLTTAVSAAGSVSKLESSTTVSANGTCQVTLVVQLLLDSVPETLRYPLPAAARDITLNGTAAKTSQDSLNRWVILSSVITTAGSHTFTIHYTLPDTVTTQKNGSLRLQLELLSGFDYPISAMDFTITLPGDITERPDFSSTYHPASVELLMDYTMENGVISGSFKEGLKDHENLTMTLTVPDSVFPQPIVKRWAMSTDDVLMYALAILALLYWLLRLRCPIPRRIHRTQPPEGITAGELGCCLVGQGVDLNTMVLSWAQMGYLSLELDRNRRLRLRKRMDMGNERSEFEIRCFKTLFGSRHIVDAGGEHYARLGRKASRTLPQAGNYFQRHSGNPNVLRCLGAGIGICAGISLATSFATDTAWQVGLGLVLAPLGAVTCWHLHTIPRALYLRRKNPIFPTAVLVVIWFLLSIWAREVNVALFVTLTQLLIGLASTYGGRRTELGKQSMSQILALRRYLRKLNAQELQQLLQSDPDYFFTMAPWAVALGVDRRFAWNFGQRKLPPCPYLSTRADTALTAKQWNDLLRQVMSILDERQKPALLQRLHRK